MNEEFEAWLAELDYELEQCEDSRDNLPYLLHQWWDMWDHGIEPEDAASAAFILLPGRNVPEPAHPAYDDGTTPCHDCGINTLPLDFPDRAEWYMVTNKIWKAHGCGEGFLCIGCLEKRMGRTLTAKDFTVCPVNDLKISDDRYAWSFRTPRLVSRLSANKRQEKAA